MIRRYSEGVYDLQAVQLLQSFLGLAFHPGLTRDTKYFKQKGAVKMYKDLYVHKGETFNGSIKILDKNNEHFYIGKNDRIILEIKETRKKTDNNGKQYYEVVHSIELTDNDMIDGLYPFSISSAKTDSFDLGDYYYCVKVVFSDGAVLFATANSILKVNLPIMKSEPYDDKNLIVGQIERAKYEIISERSLYHKQEEEICQLMDSFYSLDSNAIAKIGSFGEFNVLCINENIDHNTLNTEEFLAQINGMIENYGLFNYVITGMFDCSENPWKSTYKSALREQFGLRYLDVEEYAKIPIFNNNGNSICSSAILKLYQLVPDESDIAQIARHYYPVKIRSADGKYSEYFYMFSAMMITKRAQELGFLPRFEEVENTDSLNGRDYKEAFENTTRLFKQEIARLQGIIKHNDTKTDAIAGAVASIDSLSVTTDQRIENILSSINSLERTVNLISNNVSDEPAYININTANDIFSLKEKTSILKERVQALTENVYEGEFQELIPLDTFTAGISGTVPVDGRYTNALLEDMNGARSIAVYAVEPNTKYRITATAFYNNYHGLAAVFTNSISQPIINETYHILEGYDYYIGSDNPEVNRTLTTEIESPDEATYLILSRQSTTPTAFKKIFVSSVISRLETDLNNAADSLSVISEKLEEVMDKTLEETHGYVEITDGLTVLSGGGLIVANKQNDAYNVASLDANNSQYSYTIGCNVTENEQFKVFCRSYANNYTGVGIVFSASESNIPVWTNSIPIIPTSNYDCFAGNTSSAWNPCEYEVTVPEGAKKVWIKGSSSDDTKIFKSRAIYNSKIPTRTSELINDSDFVSNTKLPVICFDFDQIIGESPQTAIDSRFTILKSYGFTGNVVESGNAEITQKLVKMGFDISPYIGNHSSFDYTTDTNGNLAQNITEKMTRLESQGIYNPIMISCSGHKDADILEEELDADFNVKFIRARSYYKKDGSYEYVYPSGNSLSRRIVSPIIMEGGRTASSINSEIDNLVNNNVPIIMPMMHAFSSIGGSSDVTEETFEEVVAHVKELVDNGQALCMNMHEYYAYHYPEEAKQDDYVRIMSAVFDKEQVS